jgi:hypothetical protein
MLSIVEESVALLSKKEDITIHLQYRGRIAQFMSSELLHLSLHKTPVLSRRQPICTYIYKVITPVHIFSVVVCAQRQVRVCKPRDKHILAAGSSDTTHNLLISSCYVLLCLAERLEILGVQ